MATDKKALSIYVRQDLAELIASNAIADGRTVSNYLERLLDRVVPTTVLAAPGHEQARQVMASKQIDLVDAVDEIVRSVKRGPIKSAAKHK